MKNFDDICKHYTLTKYLYISLGVIFTALLVPKGLNLLGINMPDIFTKPFESTFFPNIENGLLLASKILLITYLIVNIILLLLFIKKSQAKVFFRLSIIISLLLPVIYVTESFFNFVKPITDFLNEQFDKFAIISITLSAILFIVGIAFGVFKEKNNQYKPRLYDYICCILVISFNILFLIATKDLFSLSNNFFIVFNKYFFFAIFTLILGVIQSITGSNKFFEIKK